MDINELEVYQFSRLFDLLGNEKELINYVTCNKKSDVLKSIKTGTLVYTVYAIKDVELINRKSFYYSVAYSVMNDNMEKRKGFHRDHIVPISFCYKIGVPCELVSINDNLRYIGVDDNFNKFSFLDDEVIGKLRVLCDIWGLDFPASSIIEGHNKTAGFMFRNLKKGRFGNMKGVGG